VGLHEGPRRRGPIVRIPNHHKGAVKSTYAITEVDAVAAYWGALDRSYLLPVGLIAERFSVQLRTKPARNGQLAALHWAADYELPGAIAQLGERLSGTQEVAGSSPASSTFRPDGEASGAHEFIGAHEFRNRFG
jgi:PD-(D/E)XK endonuclease